MIAKITGVLLKTDTYTNKNGVSVPTADIYIDADGDTIRVYGLDCSSIKKFDTVSADVQIMSGQNGLYVRVPKN